MRIAVLGATSQIAKDLIVSISTAEDSDLHLFARQPEEVKKWLTSVRLTGHYPVYEFAEFGSDIFDAIINFVGVGNPAKTALIGGSIFDVTAHFDEMALGYLAKHPNCRYLFMSSGAAYGSNFSEPATSATTASIPINHLSPQDWYGIAKLYAECRHRSLPDLAIVDLRIFNYFSRNQDLQARFLISDILRSIQEKTILQTSSTDIVRDFLHPLDFHQLVMAILTSPAVNGVVDCYSQATISKSALLTAMAETFGLRFQVDESALYVNATGGKSNYYSINRHAATFGYQPQLTSLDGVLMESKIILSID